jgi:hypothetical protein
MRGLPDFCVPIQMKRKSFMNELTELLQQRAGLSPDQAQAAAHAIATFIASKIPASLQAEVMPLLGMQSGGADSGELGSLLGSVEGLLGGKL